MKRSATSLLEDSEKKKRKKNSSVKSSNNTTSLSDVIETKEKKKRKKYTRSEEEKERDLKKHEEITRNGEEILPTNIKKYFGCIFKHKTGKNPFQVNAKGKYKALRFETEEKAKGYIIENNIKLGLPIKNKIYLYKGEHYVELTQSQLAKFSIGDIDVVQNHTLCAGYDSSTNTFYALTSLYSEKESKSVGCHFHNLLFPNPGAGMSVDHHNRDPLDNTTGPTGNLRIVSLAIQCINRNKLSHNKTGVVGVYYQKTGKSYVADWRENKKRHTKSFSVAEYGKEEAFKKAVCFRKTKEKSIEDYVKALSRST